MDISSWGWGCLAWCQLGSCDEGWRLALTDGVLPAKMVTAYSSWWKASPELERKRWKSWGFVTFVNLRYCPARHSLSHAQKQVGRLPTLQKFRLPQVVLTMECGQFACFSSLFRSRVLRRSRREGLWFSCGTASCTRTECCFVLVWHRNASQVLI